MSKNPFNIKQPKSKEYFGSSGSNLFLRDFLKQESEKREASLAVEKEKALTAEQMRKPREILLSNMKRIKRLSDQIPAGKPGISRFASGIQSSIKGFMQTMPQLNTYNRFKDVILGSVVQTIGSETSSRLSDQDIERMKNAFPNLPYDSEEQKALSWDIFFDTVNNVAQTYGTSPVPKEQFFNEKDYSVLKNIPGSSFYQQVKERQQAIQAIQSGKDAKKIADIFRSRTGQELNG